MTTTSNDVCAECGGALAAGMDLPPCLCTLTVSEPVTPETAGGGETHARALRCPGCGGWLESDARRCTYCSIQLATVRCWRCFELAFAGSSSCAGCGAKLSLAGPLGPTDHACLSCPDERLHLVVVGDHRVEECTRCGGIFVDRETLQSLTRATEAQGVGRLVRDAEPVARKYTEFRYRGCPSCGALMNRRNFGARSGVIVDVCKQHGVWFDADELTAVLAFVARGGLAEAERRARENAKHELSGRRLDALVQQSRQRSLVRDEGAFGIDSAAALLGAVVELFR